MDRKIVYPGSIPLDLDILTSEQNAMISLGYLALATVGASTSVVGLPCNPTNPASMTVNVGPGAIFQMEQIEATAFGSLPIDISPLMKIGINKEGAGTNFTLTAPGASGQSINYLIEAQFQEIDGTPVVLPYYNAANPAQPYAGPNNNGVAQNTIRAQIVALQLKAGAAANTGTQQTPAVDSGWTGLYVITVNYGQSTVTASSISSYPGAPFVGGNYQLYQQFCVDHGSAGAYVPYPSGTATAPTVGQTVKFFAAAGPNVGPCTLNYGGLGALPFVSRRGSAFTGNEIVAGQLVEALYNGTSWQAANTAAPDSAAAGIVSGYALPTVTNLNAAGLGYAQYASTASNAPHAVAGIVETVSTDGSASGDSSDLLMQTAYQNNGLQFWRVNLNNAGWSAWLPFASLNSVQTFTKSQAAAIQNITYASTITLDLTQGNDVAVTLTGNTTFANPSNMVPGTSGHLYITQDSTGSRTAAWGSYWDFGSSGAPTLTTTASKTDLVAYTIVSSSKIICSFLAGF
jgi:hypothetical protein